MTSVFTALVLFAATAAALAADGGSLGEVTITTADGRETAYGALPSSEHALVTLVVNVASQCGYTPQYAELQELYAAHGERGENRL